MLFNGSSGYISISESGDMDFGTADFTIDAWVNFSATGDRTILAGTSSGDLMLSRFSDNTLRIGTSLVAWQSTSSAQTWTNGTWYHIAIARSGSTLKMYKDGVQIYSGTNTTSYNFTASVVVGVRESTVGYMSGYIDELRISKGVALWTSAFTPPTSAIISSPVACSKD